MLGVPVAGIAAFGSELVILGIPAVPLLLTWGFGISAAPAAVATEDEGVTVSTQPGRDHCGNEAKSCAPRPASPACYVPRRFLLQWHVTERCNCRCAHCYQEFPPQAELPFEDLLHILEQFRHLLSSWREELGDEPLHAHITVTGGEPFLREDFMNLLEVIAANRRCFGFSILTNGSFIDAVMARRLRKLGPTYVQVSVEGVQATHNGIRGQGDFERTVAAVRHLVRAKVRTNLSFTAHRGNFREFAEVARLGRRLKVARVWSDRFLPLGTGSGMHDQVLSPDETRELFCLMHEAQRRARCLWFSKTEVAMHRALQFLVGGGRPYRCTAGDTLLTVMPNGDLYPCRRMPIRVGNLLEAPLAELYRESELLQSLRDRNRVSQGCEECTWSLLCNGGLRCLSYATTGDSFIADPGCWLARNRGPLSSL